MFSFFRKKTKPFVPPPCRHRWQDFPWYLTIDCVNGVVTVQVIESYVCIYCKERKNEVLHTGRYTGQTYESAKVIKAEWENRYKDYLADRAIVEDQVKDMQLVDREYLEIKKALEDMDKTSSSVKGLFTYEELGKLTATSSV